MFKSIQFQYSGRVYSRTYHDYSWPFRHFCGQQLHEISFFYAASVVPHRILSLSNITINYRDWHS